MIKNKCLLNKYNICDRTFHFSPQLQQLLWLVVQEIIRHYITRQTSTPGYRPSIRFVKETGPAP